MFPKSPHHHHHVTKTSYAERAATSPHPLSAYLLRLMEVKRSNLCLSADVSTTSLLLRLADSCGPHIVILKTHYDLISNWDYSPQTGTGPRLLQLARKHGFLIFEDRKFGDIGHTAQLQYTDGTARIIEWSHITNVNMVPGKAVVDSLAVAAARWRERKRYEVKTDISVGTPRPESTDSDVDEDGEKGQEKALGKIEEKVQEKGQQENAQGKVAWQWQEGMENEHNDRLQSQIVNTGRKASIVSVTTVSQHFEPVNTPRLKTDFEEEVFEGIEEAPLERGLLILAQMSSKGNFMTSDYTRACVEAAREHKSYVMGFISMESVNTEPDDAFLCMTPGCQLPPEGEGEDNEDAAAADGVAEVKGDGMGQQYNTPKKIVSLLGNDIVIVGRGIIKAADPVKEAQRYRRVAWEAYEERIGA